MPVNSSPVLTRDGRANKELTRGKAKQNPSKDLAVLSKDARHIKWMTEKTTPDQFTVSVPAGDRERRTRMELEKMRGRFYFKHLAYYISQGLIRTYRSEFSDELLIAIGNEYFGNQAFMPFSVEDQACEPDPRRKRPTK